MGGGGRPRAKNSIVTNKFAEKPERITCDAVKASNAKLNGPYLLDFSVCDEEAWLVAILMLP